MKGHRKLLVALLVALVIGAVGYGLMGKPVRVQTATVGRGPMKVTVEEDGRTRVKDRYTVTAPVAGYLRRVTLNEGDPVAAGQEVAVLEPLRPEYLDPRARARAEADVEAAEAAMAAAAEEAEAASASARLASTELARAHELFDKGIVSREELDRAETSDRTAGAALRSANFNREVARHTLEAARTSLQYTATSAPAPGETVKIKSPVEGRVFRVFRESEGVVTASEPVMEIGDPAAIEVEVDLLSADAVKVHPGTRVLFERWGGDGPIEGRVRVVEPSGFMKVSALGVEEQRVYVISDITTPFDKWQGLGDGYRVDASFIIWEAGDILQVPESALFRHGSGWAAFVVRDGRAEVTELVLGHRNGVTAELLSGLNMGETVIVHPGREVEDGAKVSPWEE